LELVREGVVGEFSEGTGIINSKADFDKIIALPGFVKVVNQINWCGGFLSGIRGCAPIPGNSMVVVRMDTNLEGILWLHEFGHTKGNRHRDSDTAVMYYALGPNRTRLSNEECTSLGQATAGGGGGAISASMVSTIPEEAESLPDVVDFVQRTYIHGLPYDAASRYPPSAVPTLLAMLESVDEDSRYLTNVVLTLGIIGDDEVARRLVRFVSEGTGRPSSGVVSKEVYVAKTSAVMALGFLANRQSNTALNYLLESLQPGIWTRRGVSWASPIHPDTAGRDLQLTQMAIIALALSGREPAGDALRAVQGQPRTFAPPGFPEAALQPISDLLAEALTAHGEVDRQGLKSYYEK
jgi:hypothetical protein